MGIRSSRAGIVVCVDSDVVCTPSFLTKLLGALGAHKNWVAAEASVIPIEGSDSPLWDAPYNKGGAYLTAASAYRMEGLVCAGGFDETMVVCEDPELATRLFRLGEYGYVPDAVVYHPRRRVTLRTHWQSRRHWKYVMILAKRHGFLAFPGKSAGRFPRVRVALAAVVTLPAGRFIEGMRHLRNNVRIGALACAYAIFDVFCGLCALPEILFSKVPPQRNYLVREEGAPSSAHEVG